MINMNSYNAIGYYNYNSMISRLNNNYQNKNSSNTIFDMFLNKSISYNNSNSINKLNTILSNYQNNYKENIIKLENYKKDSTKFYTDFSDKFSDLKDSSSKLKLYTTNSAFNPIGYESENQDVVSVKNSGYYKGSDISINVEQIATSQTTESNSVKSNDTDLIKNGNLSIDVGNKNYNFNLDLTKSKNNNDAINTISSEINKANIGLKASVVEKDGRSTLEISSKDTGEKSSFKARFDGDLSKNINLSTTKEAQNAKYTVDNTKYTSETNKVNIKNDLIKLNLNGIGNTTISNSKFDNSKVVEAVKQFAKDYNSVVDFLKDNSKKSTEIDNLAYSFSTSRFMESSLSSIGINVDSAGKLSVNEDTLKSSISNNINKVKDVLSKSSGLADNTYKKVNEAMYKAKDLYPELKLDNNYSNTYSYNNSNIIMSQYNSLYTNGVFLNYFI